MLLKKLIQAVGFSTALLSTSAQAMTLDWNGGYRFEWTEIDRPSLANPGQRKAYGLNYLYLSPKIIAADGVNVVSRFDVLNSTAYPHSQLGEIWGLNAHAIQGQSAVTSNNQGATNIHVSQLYLSVNQEYGALIAGRAPFEFGLGMTYNAGRGAFDHWYDTRDMVAYKIVVGDWFFMPVLSRKLSSGFGQGGTISSTGFQLQYESEENKSLIGIFQESTKAPSNAVAYSIGQIDAYGGTGKAGDLNIQRTNFVLGRGFDSFGFKIEAGFQSGETGIEKGGESVNLNGYGIASEFYIPRNESKWDMKLKLGMATGDDSTSKDFSGFAFNRNYDVGMLLFNHRLGQKDFLHTNPYRYDTDATDAANGTLAKVGDSADDEFVSNTVYIAPSVGYSYSDRMEVRNTFIYAQLVQQVKNSVDSSKLLGLEWDIEFIYKPSEKVQWINQIGVLLPGEAFKNGTGLSGNLDNGLNYGFASKAAISF